MEYDREKGKQGRDLSTFEVLAALREDLPAVWERAEVVGRWVWVSFDAKPDSETRRGLLELGFHWNRKRQTWQHCCGVPSIHSAGNPKNRYGTLPAPVFADETATA